MTFESQPTSETGLRAPRTFAIRIGIDNYQASHMPKRSGSVNDAVQLYRLLRLVAGIPEDQISLLCDQEATRVGILDEFKSLIANPTVQRGDTVVVYFSGLVKLAPAPIGSDVGLLETICPVDEGVQESGLESHGIPDRTIAALLFQLLQTHDLNIVRPSVH